MKTLSDSELWERVASLEGKTVCTIERRFPNGVARVTDKDVELLKPSGQPRPSTPLRTEIASTYQYLVRYGEVTGVDFGAIPGHRPRGPVRRIILAILRDALPEEVEEFHRGPGQPRSGIRLKAVAEIPTKCRDLRAAKWLPWWCRGVCTRTGTRLCYWLCKRIGKVKTPRS